jgi:hypothetical protein
MQVGQLRQRLKWLTNTTRITGTILQLQRDPPKR